METSLGDDVTETPEIEEELLSQTINAHSPETQVKKKKSLLSEVLVNGLLKNINEKVTCLDIIINDINMSPSSLKFKCLKRPWALAESI